MKKFFLLFFSLFFLYSCGSDEVSVENSSDLKQQETEFFSIFLPASWDILDPEADLPKIASGNDKVLASRAVQQTELITHNFNILSQDIKIAQTSYEYMQKNSILARKNFQNFVSISAEKEAFSDGKDVGLFTVFEAQYNSLEPKITYIQTARICSNKVFLMTVSLSPTEKDYNKYTTFLKTFSCKD